MNINSINTSKLNIENGSLNQSSSSFICNLNYNDKTPDFTIDMSIEKKDVNTVRFGFIDNKSYKTVINLENYIVNQVSINSKKIIGTELSKNSLLNMLSSVIKLSDDLSHPPVLEFNDVDLDLDYQVGDLVKLSIYLKSIEFHKQYYRLNIILNNVLEKINHVQEHYKNLDYLSEEDEILLLQNI
jgi:hypothetical protein